MGGVRATSHATAWLTDSATSTATSSRDACPVMFLPKEKTLRGKRSLTLYSSVGVADRPTSTAPIHAPLMRHRGTPP